MNKSSMPSKESYSPRKKKGMGGITFASSSFDPSPYLNDSSNNNNAYIQQQHQQQQQYMNNNHREHEEIVYHNNRKV